MTTLMTVSLIGGMMILVITGLRALLQNRLHRTVFLLLWLLVAVRLVVPMVIPSTASVYNFIPQRGVQGKAAVGTVAMPAFQGNVSDFGEATYTPTMDGIMGNGSAPVVVYPSEGESVSVETDTSVDLGLIMKWIWVGGSGICFLYFAWIHIRARLQYRFALPEDGPAFLGRIRLKRSDAVSAPLVYGFFRPVILLPLEFPKKDSPEYEQVLYHELTHVRSGDLWFKLGMLLVTCVHWFNPLVWLMLHLSTQDLEIRCDARVIRKLGKKKTYAMALVQAEVNRSNHFAEAAFAFSLTELRLKAISKAKVYLPRSIILCMILSVVLVFCFSTGPLANATTEEAQEPAVTESTAAHAPTETQVLPETEAPTEESTQEPSATVQRDEETEMEYLLSQDYEEHSSVLELYLKEGTKKTVALKLPEHAVFTVEPQGESILAAEWDYNPAEALCYLTVEALDEGETVIHVSISDRQWMIVKVSVAFDPYFSVSDAWDFEGYGKEMQGTLTKGQWSTFKLKLPERTTYYSESYGGNMMPWETDCLDIETWYDDQDSSLCVSVKSNKIGSGDIYFYIDGVYWCKMHVEIEYKSYWNYSSGNPDSDNDIGSTFNSSSYLQGMPIGSIDLPDLGDTESEP